MANAKFIGLGACGNKAVANLIEKNVIDRSQAILMNSTTKDIPENYKDIAVCFSDSLGGCGKERNTAKNLILSALKSEKIPTESFLDPQDDFIGIIASSEGGTGSGASVVLAKYFKEVIGIPVHLFLFTGFEEDGRGLQNTVEYFQDLDDEYIVEVISNKKFLQSCGTKPRAEKAANDELGRRIMLLLGHSLADSEQNIDETDLYKIITTPGFLTIEYATLEKVKSVDMFNKAVLDMINDTKSLDFEPTAKRIGVILNVSDKTKEYIDYSFSVIKEKLGTPYEIFTHIQNNSGTEYVAVIASGLKMPIDDVKAIYEKYRDESERVVKTKDDFFGLATDLKKNSVDSMFDVGGKKEAKGISVQTKQDFFTQMSGGQLGSFKNTKVKIVTDNTSEF